MVILVSSYVLVIYCCWDKYHACNEKGQLNLFVLQLFMVRNTGALNFSAAHHGWRDFSRGFGNLSREFWLGNAILHKITHGAPYELRVELVALDDDVRTANYRRFLLGDERSHFTMVAEKYDQSSSDAGEVMHVPLA